MVSRLGNEGQQGPACLQRRDLAQKVAPLALTCSSDTEAHPMKPIDGPSISEHGSEMADNHRFLACDWVKLTRQPSSCLPFKCWTSHCCTKVLSTL